MPRPQLAVRISPSLEKALAEHIQRTGLTKTQIVEDALAKYLQCSDEPLLPQRLAALEQRVTVLEGQQTTQRCQTT